jgi:uncharacterized repeat protein (TIGR01451 family)
MNKWIIPVMIAIVALLMPMSSSTVSAQDGAGLSISKSAAPTLAAVGDSITYTYTITNNGPVIIDSIALTDDPLGTIDLGGVTSLNAGGTTAATATYIVVEADLPGPLVNTATVSGTDPDDNTVTASATASVGLTGNASLQLTKSADRSSASPHQTINYSYSITNNGNVTINNLSLQDDKLGALSLSSATLAPGKSLTATASHAVTIADLPGPIVNTATVSGTDSTGKSISVTSEPVSVSLHTNVWELFKSEILKLMGVPGKGIEKAPGLQKPFNPRSKAAEHHGVSTDNVSQKTPPKIKKPLNPKSQASDISASTDNVTPTKSEILKRSGVEGEGIDAAPGLQKPFNPKSQAAEHAGKKNNGSTDNQTGTQGASDNGHKHGKGKTNNGSKSGK